VIVNDEGQPVSDWQRRINERLVAAGLVSLPTKTASVVHLRELAGSVLN